MISTDMPTNTANNNTENYTTQPNRGSELASILASGRRRRVVLCEDEMAGLRHIIANPEPPTQELIAACEEYADFAFHHPNSNW